ncbi:hypothetical protein XPA_005475 [Xanthoria parietina]
MDAINMASCNTCRRTFRHPVAAENHQRSTGHCYCRHCSQPFRHEQAFAQHQGAFHDYRCGICNRAFPYSQRLQDHQRSTGHGFCRKCEAYFASKDALKQHRRALHEHHCAHCTSVFPTATGLQDHQRNKNHCYRQESDRFFTTQEAHSQHLRSSIHVSQFRCLECERDFSSGQALEQHLNDKRNHRPSSSITPLEDGPCTCDECDREFTTRSALKQHLESLVHRPLSRLRCIASRKCKGRFSSPSALLHHLESGACRSNMTRASLNQLISTHDQGNMITFGTQLGSLFDSAGHDRTFAEASSPGFLTPSSHSSDAYSTLTGAQAPTPALSPDCFTLGTGRPMICRAGKFVCPLCPVQSKGFRTVHALDDHLASPAHAPKIFHCPVDLSNLAKKGRQTEEMIKDFSTLSGMTQHIESGACEGGRQTLEGAMEFVQERLKALGFKNIKLLT